MVGSGKKYAESLPFDIRRDFFFFFLIFQSNFFFQALQYNVPRGKKNRGLATVQAYKTLVEDEKKLTPENVRLAHYLGWCIEMVCIDCRFQI